MDPGIGKTFIWNIPDFPLGIPRRVWPRDCTPNTENHPDFVAMTQGRNSKEQKSPLGCLKSWGNWKWWPASSFPNGSLVTRDKVRKLFFRFTSWISAPYRVYNLELRPVHFQIRDLGLSHRLYDTNFYNMHWQSFITDLILKRALIWNVNEAMV